MKAPSQTPPPTFTQYVRATNVALAVEGVAPVSIVQLEQTFGMFVRASIRREQRRVGV